MMINSHTFRLTIAAALVLALCGLGCDDDVQLSNLPGHVTFVGPTQVADDHLETFFGVSDPEGDLVRATVEVCVGGSCSELEPLAGSAPLDTLPSVDRDKSTALRLLWRPTCADIGLEAPFSIKMKVPGSDVPEVESPAQTLGALGYVCP